jgi:hypothetical protein
LQQVPGKLTSTAYKRVPGETGVSVHLRQNTLLGASRRTLCAWPQKMLRVARVLFPPAGRREWKMSFI